MAGLEEVFSSDLPGSGLIVTGGEMPPAGRLVRITEQAVQEARHP